MRFCRKSLVLKQRYTQRNYTAGLCKDLSENAPQEMLSEAQIVDWCIKQGLECFFDLNCGDLILRLRQLVSQLTVIKTGLQCQRFFRVMVLVLSFMTIKQDGL